MIGQDILERLCLPEKKDRLAELKKIVKTTDFIPADRRYINNHIHTTYSFSPYSPSAAVYAARAEGLSTAGIVDHDSIGGAREFIEAGEIASIPTTIGLECRVSMDGTALEGKCTNNPDQVGVSYVTIQGVPHGSIETLQAYFAPLREKRNIRNRKMTDNINSLFTAHSIALDFDRDVLPLSMAHDGGSVTERHLMFALAKAMIGSAGRGEGVISLLRSLGTELTQKQADLLLDTEHPFYEYDLLGILKSAFVPKIFVPATDECPLLSDFTALSDSIGAVACYAYLGDVGESVTGDKKAQKFEDDYLEELLEVLTRNNIRAITYMPTRNTKEQLTRLRSLLQKYKLFQVSGEDINSPRQSFVCKAMEDPMFGNLIDSTWALIAHERGEKKINF
jgi:hypothetical protein